MAAYCDLPVIFEIGISIEVKQLHLPNLNLIQTPSTVGVQKINRGSSVYWKKLNNRR